MRLVTADTIFGRMILRFVNVVRLSGSRTRWHGPLRLPRTRRRSSWMDVNTSPIAALFIYQSGAVVISVMYAFIFYKVVTGVVKPLAERWLDQMEAISRTQGELLEAFRNFNGKH